MRFSLRTLLLAITILCIWLGLTITATRRQREAVTAIRKSGGSVGYDFQFVVVPGKPDWSFVADHAVPPQPAWLRTLLGDDFFCDVFTVAFFNLPNSIPESDLAQLTKLPKLRLVYLTNVKIVSDGSSIQRPIQDRDIEVLGRLGMPKYLDLTGSKFTPEGLRKLRQLLPSTNIIQ